MMESRAEAARSPDPDTGTLTPLPRRHRQGITAVGCAAAASLLATAALFLFLTYVYASWQLERWRARRRARKRRRRSLDLSLGLPGCRASEIDSSSDGRRDEPAGAPSSSSIRSRRPRNPFPHLIYHILLAEIHTSVGYSVNLIWVAHDGVFEGSSACWVQGWFNSLGILAASLFFILMSVTTYLAVVWGWRPPQRVTQTAVLLVWLVVYLMCSLPIAATDDGRARGGWYVRAGAWVRNTPSPPLPPPSRVRLSPTVRERGTNSSLQCWVNAQYGSAWMWSDWGWVLASIPVTVITYSLVFYSLFRENRSSRHLPRRLVQAGGTNKPSGHHPAFLVYPFIYLTCTAPLAVGRLMATMGHSPDTLYYCLAGLVLATSGLWNTILWLTTMVFATPEDMRNTGLDQFAFVRTPRRDYGNRVWIQGPARAPRAPWWWWQLGGEARPKHKAARGSSQSQETLRPGIAVEDNAIQLDVTTTITVDRLDPELAPEGLKRAYSGRRNDGR